MNDKELYSMSWRQDYPEYQEAIDTLMDTLLELTEYTEAKQVIANVKSKLGN